MNREKKYIIHFRGIKIVWDQVIITGKFEPITLINFPLHRQENNSHSK